MDNSVVSNTIMVYPFQTKDSMGDAPVYKGTTSIFVVYLPVINKYPTNDANPLIRATG